MKRFSHLPCVTVYDDQNLIVHPYGALDIWRYRSEHHLSPGETLWYELVPEVDFQTIPVPRVAHGIPNPKPRYCPERQRPLHVKRVGNYVRFFRLWNGPSRKLADWRQLPSGSSMMLSPVECEAEEDIACFRTGHLARQGEGSFDVHTREDGSLWVSKS